ncbi:uncharacterized protein LOC127030990 [Gopherus flavomarginatus]|uniref:uncharacterized protein LOC127030990 n=1 Tax=Gopherus flavomarginatus TaxID=286002 RepID=UPI0021CC4BF5|nr:uncharacterized protein LOC127030990 [Gopherus flavomarginatus]
MASDQFPFVCKFIAFITDLRKKISNQGDQKDRERERERERTHLVEKSESQTSCVNDYRSSKGVENQAPGRNQQKSLEGEKLLVLSRRWRSFSIGLGSSLSLRQRKELLEQDAKILCLSLSCCHSLSPNVNSAPSAVFIVDISSLQVLRWGDTRTGSDKQSTMGQEERTRYPQASWRVFPNGISLVYNKCSSHRISGFGRDLKRSSGLTPCSEQDQSPDRFLP